MRVYAHGCIYNGISSSKMGLMLSSFNGTGFETNSAGSKIDIVSQRLSNRNKEHVYAAKYKDSLSFKLQLTKKDHSEMLRHELVEYGRWLQHKTPKRFQFTDCNFTDIEFYAIATEVNELSVAGVVYGIEVLMKTNAPFGYSKPITRTVSLSSTPYKYINPSEEYGYVYPSMKITVQNDGDLTITNAIEGRETTVTNCLAGEIITLDADLKTIESTNTDGLYDRFNYKWFRFCRSEDTNINSITASIPCKVEFTYQNIKKVGVS